MHYRRSSPNPPRLLLRIVAAAGAGAVVGACSSGSGPGSHPLGLADSAPDAGDNCCPGAVDTGASDIPDASADTDAELHCGIGVCGSIVEPDADGVPGDGGGNDCGSCFVGGGLFDTGGSYVPDGGTDADAALCGVGVCGIVIEPDAAEAGVYREMYPLFRELYFGLAEKSSALAQLRGIARY